MKTEPDEDLDLMPPAFAEGLDDWARGDGTPESPTYDRIESARIAMNDRDFGACMSPTNAFQILQGVETLGPRMDRHLANTRAVLEFLSANKAVDWVTHPSLPDHPDHELARTLLPNGAGSIISFGIKGGRAAGRKFIESLRLISHLANVGDAKTLVIHPASTTHQQMDAEQLKVAGIGEELVRLSVGIEAAQDILDDLGQALRASQKA